MKTITRPLPGLSAPAAALFLSLFATASAHAHHPMGGGLVTNTFEGFLSGVAHPVIGVDHLAMIIGIGILAAAMRPGFLLAAVFVVGGLGGTGLHLLGLSLPGSEGLVSLSVVAVGILLALRQTPKAGLVVGACAAAGFLHGYAYGESIVGAESAPLTAYLAGFTFIQLAVAAGAYVIARELQKRTGEPGLVLRAAGCAVAGAGLALFATQIAALSSPVG